MLRRLAPVGPCREVREEGACIGREREDGRWNPARPLSNMGSGNIFDHKKEYLGESYASKMRPSPYKVPPRLPEMGGLWGCGLRRNLYIYYLLDQLQDDLRQP